MRKLSLNEKKGLTSAEEALPPGSGPELAVLRTQFTQRPREWAVAWGTCPQAQAR